MTDHASAIRAAGESLRNICVLNNAPSADCYYRDGLSGLPEMGIVARQLWDRAPFSYLGLLSDVLGRATLEPAAAGGYGLVWTTISCADRARHGLSLDAVEPVIDVVRRTDEADVAVVLKQSDDGLWQVSARSRGAVDVGRACAALGGGGHRSAAGFTAPGGPAEALAALRPLLAEDS